MRWACLLLGALSCVGAQRATAQPHPSVRVNRYHPAELPGDGFAVNGGGVGEHLRPAAKLVVDYSNDPLVFESAQGDAASEQVALVSHQLTANLIGTLGLFDQAALFVGLPIHLVLDGTTVGEQPAATGFAAGDFWGGARVHFSPAGSQLTAAIQLRMGASTSPDSETHAGVAGESGLTAHPVLIGDYHPGRLALAANVGILLRQDKEIINLRFSDELTYGLSLRYSIIPSTLVAHAEAFGSTPMEDVGDVASTPFEALLGMKLVLPYGLTAGLAGGLGLLRGYGSPDARGILSIEFEADKTRPAHDTPEETRAPEEESPDNQPEMTTVDPDLDEPAPGQDPEEPDDTYSDSDGDATLDQDDACPRLPGPARERGCPKSLRLEASSGEIELLDRIAFHAGRTTLRARSDAVLADLMALLESDRALHLRFSVHARGAGRRLDAMTLSQRRARALLNLLRERGARPGRLQGFGCGDTRVRGGRGLRAGQRGERVQAWIIRPLPPQGMPSTFGCQRIGWPDKTPAAVTTGPPPTAPPSNTHPAALVKPPKPARETNSDPDADGLDGATDECPSAPGSSKNRGCPRHIVLDQAGARITLGRPIKFSDDKARVRGRSQSLLDEVHAVLLANPTMRLLVEGHSADERGRRLWTARARSVRAKLTGNGISVDRLQAAGCGAYHALVSNAAAWGRKKNQRIEFHLLDPSPATGVTLRAGCKPSE